MGKRAASRLDDHLIYVAPAPPLAGLEESDYRMAWKARCVLSSTTDFWESLDAKPVVEETPV